MCTVCCEGPLDPGNPAICHAGIVWVGVSGSCSSLWFLCRFCFLVGPLFVYVYPTPQRQPSRAFAPGLSVSDCRIALTQAAATDAPPSNDTVLTLPEYSFFLERLGDSVCFEPDPRNFGLAREAAFARLQCEPLGTCQGTTTTTTNNAADLTIEVAYFLDNEERLTEFCQNSWIWAMNGAQCAVPTVSPAPSSSAAPSGEVDTRSVTSAATPFRWSGRTNRFVWWSVLLLLSVVGFVVAER